MNKPVLVGILLALALLAAIVYSTMNLARFRVEVCVAYKGLTNCRIASGSTEEFATRTAKTNACAGIVSGVTDTIGCENTDPVKVTRLK